MGASHASKGGRRWRYYVSRAALSGRKQEAGSVVRIPAPEIENLIANAVGAHLAARANAIDGCHIDHGGGRGDCAITQHESGRGQRLAGGFRRRARENGWNSVRRPRRGSLTYRNREGSFSPGNQVGLPRLDGGGRSLLKPVSVAGFPC